MGFRLGALKISFKVQCSGSNIVCSVSQRNFSAFSRREFLAGSLMKILTQNLIKTFRRRKHWTRNRMEARKPLICSYFLFVFVSFLVPPIRRMIHKKFQFPPENESKDEKFGVNDLNSHQIFNSLMVEEKTRKVNSTLVEKERRKPTEKRDSPKNLVESEAQRIH